MDNYRPRWRDILGFPEAEEAQSTIEAEFIVASELAWLENLWKEMKPVHQSPTLWCDNEARSCYHRHHEASQQGQSVTADDVEESGRPRMETETTVADVQFGCGFTNLPAYVGQVIPVVCIASRTAVDTPALPAFIVRDPIFALRALSQLPCLAGHTFHDRHAPLKASCNIGR
jgi:hypothetical protein